MVKYKYIENYYQDDPGSEEFCKQHNIVYFPFTQNSEKKLKKWLKKAKLPEINCEPDITCYWRPYGTWGMYHPEDNSISICPFEIEKAGGLKEVIKHEIKHLMHPEANDLPHEEKEKVISESK